jgi:hypothetical protein
MKVMISESQFERMVNSSKRWGLIGIKEGRTYTDEEKKSKSNYFELKYLDTIDGKIPSEVEKQSLYDKYGGTNDEFENARKRPITPKDYNWLRWNNEELKNKISQSRTDHISDEDVRDKAKGFNLREKFRLAYPSYYDNARRNNILDDLFPPEIEKQIRDTEKQKLIDNSIEVAKKYLSRSELQKNSVADYQTLRRAQNKYPEHSGLLDKLFPKLKESTGEKHINNILTGMGIKFEYDKSHGDCKGEEILRKGKSGKLYPFCPSYRFDFFIPNTPENAKKITNLPENGIMIEYDGEFHFYDKRTNRRPAESFDNDVKKDIRKNNYCKEKGIKLIRIPYKSNTPEKIKKDIENGFNSNELLFLGRDYPKLGWNT